MLTKLNIKRLLVQKNTAALQHFRTENHFISFTENLKKAMPNMLVSFCGMKCPKCRSAFAFRNKSIFPLKKCLDLVDYCEVCGQRMQLESNNGGGINYALTMVLFFLNIFWYWPIFGLSYKDNSFLYFIYASTLVVVLVQPWLMRYSRMIFLYFLVKYDKSYPKDAANLNKNN